MHQSCYQADPVLADAWFAEFILVKRIKRVAFRVRRFRNCRIRAMRYQQLDPPRHTRLTMRSEQPV